MKKANDAKLSHVHNICRKKLYERSQSINERLCADSAVNEFKLSPAYYLIDHNFLYIVRIHSVEVDQIYHRMLRQVQ